jgi:hypothetical protein
MLRMFKLAKASAIKARTQTINQLKAVLVAADPQLRETLSGLSNLRLIRRCTQLDVDTPQDTTSAAAYTLRLLARRIQTLTDEIRELDHQITTAVTSHTPQLPAGLSRRAWIGLRGHIDHALVAVWSAEKGGVIPHGALGWGSERTSKAGGYEHR